MTEEERK